MSMEFYRPGYWSGLLYPSSGDLPKAGMKPKSPTLQAYSLVSEPPGKPKNTGVGSWSLLQRIVPTKKLKEDLLHCRWILYQLSYRGNPSLSYMAFIMLRYVPSIPTLLRTFIINKCCILSKVFLHLLRRSHDFYSSVCSCGISHVLICGY